MRKSMGIRIALVAAACVLGSSAVFAASAENGRKAFVTNGCWQCHGFEGQGSAVTSNGAVLSNTELPFEAFEGFVRGTRFVHPVLKLGFEAPRDFHLFNDSDGVLGVGSYSALVYLTQRLLWPLTRLAEMTDLYQRSMASIERVMNDDRTGYSSVKLDMAPPGNDE